MDLFEFSGTPSPEPQRSRPKPTGSPTSSGSSRPRDRKEEKVFTITQLNRKIRFLLEASLAQVWVTGEVSNVRRQSSGHTYFTLKDAGAQLSCVLFRGDARFVQLEIDNGMQVRARGEISVYEARGQYQLIVKKLEREGQGSLQAKFEQLKEKLHSEGLFDASLKRTVTPFPSTVAIVTSPTGAAVRDVLNVVTRRAPWVKCIVVPVPVQGDGAYLEITKALKLFSVENLRGLPTIDTIILCRGGGSIEDLWNFNEEAVARAIRDCPIPVISAVGHEIDFTISDFAADLRAPTPSAAAELAVPERSALEQRLDDLQTTLTTRTRRRMEHWRQQLDWHAKGTLPREPERQLRERRLQLDSLADAMRQLARESINIAKDQHSDARHALLSASPARILERRASRLEALAERLTTSARTQIESRLRKAQTAAHLLKTLGPQSVFARGFSLTTTEDGALVTDESDVQDGDVLVTTVQSGKIESVVNQGQRDSS